MGRRRDTGLQGLVNSPTVRRSTQHIRSHCPSASDVHPASVGQRRNKGTSWGREAARFPVMAPPPRFGVQKSRGVACGLFIPQQDFLLVLMPGRGAPSGSRQWDRL